MENYFIGIAILICGAIISLFFKNQAAKLKCVSIGAVLATCATVSAALKALIISNQECILHLGSIFQNVRFVLDDLSAFFVIFISIMSTLAIIYSNGYLAPYISKGKDVSAHCIFLALLMASMLLVVTCQNALLFLIIWELMSLSSFFLVIFEHEKKEVINSGIKYLVYMHVSVIFIILFFVLLSTNAMSLDFMAFKGALANNIDLANLVFVFGFIGFGIKAGFVPFHNWLPDAHPQAPSHVSAMMSGVMIKTGIYGILRTIQFSSIPKIAIIYTVLVLTAITALYGIAYATVQKDIKKMLAYSSIENIGIIGIGISIYMLATYFGHPTMALLALCGSLVHILNHSIFKELLFLSAGSVYVKTHTKDMEVLGGLIKKMPITALCFIVGGISICALPPFNGFVSEFLIYLSFIKALAIDNFGVFIAILFAFSALALVGTMAILCFTKTISITFLGLGRSEKAEAVETDSPKTMLIPMGLLGLACFIIGLFPQYVFQYALKPASVLIENAQAGETILFLSSISKYILILVGLILAIVIVKKLISKKPQIYSTWGCGYNKLTSKVQYSAASYVSPFSSILKPLFKRNTDVRKAKGLFPKEAHYEAEFDDIEEVYVINPIIKLDEKFLSKFEKLQNGDIQQYIRVGLIFLAIALIAALILG